MQAARRRLLVPEVVQTSAMDCGPATLKCLLQGFGVPASYGRLREACQTDVDGTSIDTIEEIAVRLGLDAEQVLLPPDHLLLEEAAALPALAVVSRPHGTAHFVVVWRRHGPLVQVMDPAMGRRWLSASALIGELYRHEMPLPAAAWREWAASGEALSALRRRLRALSVPAPAVEELLRDALRDPGWRGLGALDAAARMADALVTAGALRGGAGCAALVRRLAAGAAEAPQGDEEPLIPELYWSVRRPAPDGEETGEEQVLVRGAVLVRVRGRRAEERTDEGGAPAAAPLPPALRAALAEPPSRPMRGLLRLLRQDGLLRPAALAAALVVAALGVVVEALLLRGLVDVGRDLGLIGQRLSAMGGLLVLVVALLLLELPILSGLLRLGRRLDVRLRMAVLAKLPRLGDRYLHSRLSSDMAERSHSAHALRALPARAGHLLRVSATLLFTAAAILWIDPAPGYLLLLAVVLLLPLGAQPLLMERDLRVRVHEGALSRFYLDTLLGLVAVKNHGAERTIRREHEALLAEWVAASRGRQRGAVAIEALQSLLGAGLAVGLILGHVARGSEDGSLLLLVYFTLQLPALGQEVAVELRQYPGYRNLALRLTEPLGAPEEDAEDAGPTPGGESMDESVAASAAAPPRTPGAAVRMDEVTVASSGHVILEGICLQLPAGSHVAIVGPSGAGKSSLVGLLLGFHRPAAGRVLIDGAELDGAALARLRADTAWVDPAVQLWNRSLLDNLRYGAPSGGEPPLLQVIEQAQLLDVLRALPEGLSTPLGDGGALVSGGEGQRVRLGRAMLRPAARLVILDEPFRGLDREARRALLGRARQLWRDATLLCVTHDVGETLAFDRVLVVEQGGIREDGEPQELARRRSRYRDLLDAERAVRERLWSGAGWRRLTLREGRLAEEPEEAPLDD